MSECTCYKGYSFYGLPTEEKGIQHTLDCPMWEAAPEPVDTYIFRTQGLYNYLGRGRNWGEALRDAGLQNSIIYGSRVVETGDIIKAFGKSYANQAVNPPMEFVLRKT